jgi:hypothetical protein
MYIGGSLHLSWEALLNECILVSLCTIHLEFLDLGEVAECQALDIPEVVVRYFTHPLLMSRCYRVGQSPFLITPTEMMLFFPMLSSYVHKLIVQMKGICTRDSPSMDSIWLLPKHIQERAGK